MKIGSIGFLVAGLVSLAPRAHAEEARSSRSCRALLAPSSLSLRDTGLDQNRVACATQGFLAGMRAQATIDTPNFYGTLTSSLVLEYRSLHVSGFEFFVGARVVDYRFAQSAVFTDGELGAGPLSIGAVRPRKTTWWGHPAVIGHAIRFEVPLTNLTDEALTVAASPSLLATLMPSSHVHVHGRVSALLHSILPESGADSRAALLASADIAYAPVSVFSLSAGLEAQGGWYGLGLDHLQARGGLRFGIGDGAIEISAATAPLGSERNDLVAWLGYQWIAKPKPANGDTRVRLKDWPFGGS